MLSVPNVFLRPREAAKRADEAKSKFTHIDGVSPVPGLLHHKLAVCMPGFCRHPVWFIQCLRREPPGQFALCHMLADCCR